MDFGNYNAVKFIHRTAHYSLHIAVEKLRSEVIGSYGYNLFPKVYSVECLNHYLSAFVALKLIGTRVFKFCHTMSTGDFTGSAAFWCSFKLCPGYVSSVLGTTTLFPPSKTNTISSSLFLLNYF